MVRRANPSMGAKKLCALIKKRSPELSGVGTKEVRDALAMLKSDNTAGSTGPESSVKPSSPMPVPCWTTMDTAQQEQLRLRLAKARDAVVAKARDDPEEKPAHGETESTQVEMEPPETRPFHSLFPDELAIWAADVLGYDDDEDREALDHEMNRYNIGGHQMEQMLNEPESQHRKRLRTWYPLGFKKTLLMLKDARSTYDAASGGVAAGSSEGGGGGRSEAAARSARLRTKPSVVPGVDWGSLPEQALCYVLGNHPSANFLRLVSIVSRVCTGWRSAVLAGASTAYGMGLPEAQRTQVLRAIDQAFQNCGRDPEARQFSLYGVHIGDAGGVVLAKALARLSTPLRHLNLMNCRLTAASMDLVIEALRPRLQDLEMLRINGNPIGDEAVATLATVLPASLQKLYLGGTGCGDAGMVALAAVLPSTSLNTLDCFDCSAIRIAGWSALAPAIPQIRGLMSVSFTGCSGMGNTGLIALAGEEKASFLRYHFILNPDHLPRQAQDTHKGNSKKRVDVFSQSISAVREGWTRWC